MTIFQDVDNIIRLGKWAYQQIPAGTRCKDCPLLGEVMGDSPALYCNLRRSIGLIRDQDGPFKDSFCPGRKNG